MKRAKLNLCDLAGSEKIQGLIENQDETHISELKTINLSLTTLGKVISSLAKDSKNQKKNKKQHELHDSKHPEPHNGMHIPYRDS